MILNDLESISPISPGCDWHPIISSTFSLCGGAFEFAIRGDDLVPVLRMGETLAFIDRLFTMATFAGQRGRLCCSVVDFFSYVFVLFPTSSRCDPGNGETPHPLALLSGLLGPR